MNIEYSVSEAAKILNVKPYVLRYWEDEMYLPIQRNSLGHRCYQVRDMQVLFHILEMKKDGMALKEIAKVVSSLYCYIEGTQAESRDKDAERSEQFLQIIEKLVKEKRKKEALS